MGVLIVVEGLDGSGKRTLTQALCAALVSRGLTVSDLAFPRYGKSQPADIAAEALRGEHGDLFESVNAMAALWALDRYEAKRDLVERIRESDVVVLDRYVASNAAYSAARSHQSMDGGLVEWVRQLEFERFSLPIPTLQVYLDVPVSVAEDRAQYRESTEVGRDRDAYERDSTLQSRTAGVYAELARSEWVSEWSVIPNGVDPAAAAEQLADSCTQRLARLQ
ncbi:dTMP kinase [Hoyosella rhizosphaerae]|uniref:Thymidylate kinase n=1 Tax=Hoyosella rhizosphaerae TaxID=1755582 RepID=A0A916XDW9_9ACTN|nr:dTMP kinase [Hoyosella rhizosphaerae]MBN4925996.1 dTMP kinase [Hoyosella rhizosphaerae]GGC66376.1 dTMP kinase [Hoyosella rhizosphaerae]